MKPQTLLGLDKGDRELALALEQLQKGELELPPGCDITYELEAIDILRALLRIPKEPEALRAWYENFRERHETRPTALEVHHAGYNPRSVSKTHGSWLGFVRAMDDFSQARDRVWKNETASKFLTSLDTTKMTKSYKMLTLLAMLNEDQFRGTLPVDKLVRGFARLALRSAKLRVDVDASLDDPNALRRHLERNAIAAWTGGKGTKGKTFFEYETVCSGRRSTSVLTSAKPFKSSRGSWRIGGSGSIWIGALSAPTTALSASSATPIGGPFFFSPTGETSVIIEGKTYEATVAKVAVNVVRRPGDPRNELPTLLRGWFGRTPVYPARTFMSFSATQKAAGCWSRSTSVQTPKRYPSGQSYSREQIPGLLGLQFSARKWQPGFVAHVPTRDAREERPTRRIPIRRPIFAARHLPVAKPEPQDPEGKSRPGDPKSRREGHPSPLSWCGKRRRSGQRAAPFIHCGRIPVGRRETDYRHLEAPGTRTRQALSAAHGLTVPR